MRHVGLVLILVTLLAGLAISFAETAPGSGEDKAQDAARAEPSRGDSQRREREDVPPPPLTPEQVSEAVEVMREISPWWVDRLEEAKQEDEQRFYNMVARMYPRLRQFLELRRHDPPLYKLRVEEARYDSQSRRLSWQLHQAQQRDEVEQAEKLKAELLGVLTKQFEVTQAARQHEVQTLKARLGELEQELDKHHRQRDDLIRERYEELLAGAERMDRRRGRGEGGPGVGDARPGDGEGGRGRPPGLSPGPNSDPGPGDRGRPAPPASLPADAPASQGESPQPG